MQDLYWECRVCEACGVCSRTEKECQLYHEYYEMEHAQPVSKIVKQAVQEKIEHGTKGGLVNRFTGQLVDVSKGDYMACLTIESGDKYLSSILPLQQFEELGKKEGDQVTAVFKAVNVKIMM